MNLSSKKIILIIFSGIIIAGFIFLSFVPKSLAPTQETKITTTEQKELNLPIRLKIPKINVDSVVEYVGLTASGAMDVPKDRENVAWFNLGPRPGEKGNAVIAGHYGQENKKASVFDNLYKLRVGDKVYTENNQGVTTSFVVREIKRYSPDADASLVFDSNTVSAHLNLVTCEGVWNEEAQSYSQRLVIFTDKE